jgi:acylphosphatase
MVARRAVVAGRVQGVFFRAHVARVAERHGVAGWAVNRPDGTVEVHAEGTQEAVEAVIDAARCGPERAAVLDVEVRDADVEDCCGFTTR